MMEQKRALQLLRDTIAPELNLIYTEPPRIINGGPDGGWFCREHALHVSTVCSAWGIDSDIRSGDFHVGMAGGRGITTLDGGSGHSWSRVASVTPVDLSMTFRYYPVQDQLRTAVVGQGPNGSFIVHYSTDEAVARSHDGNDAQSIIYFIERQVLTVPIEQLVTAPYLFLHPPIEGDPWTWDSLHGTDIYAKVSLHCLALAAGESDSLVGKYNSEQAIEWIKQAYSDPADKILRRLKDAQRGRVSS